MLAGITTLTKFELIESGWWRHTPSVKNYNASLAALAGLLVLACDGPKQIADSGGDGDGDAEGSAEAGVDGEGDDGWQDGDGDGDGTGDDGSPGDGDCPLGEYVPPPYDVPPEWSELSGTINHEVTHGPPGLSTQLVDARFFTSDYVDNSLLCIETIIEPIGVDSCWVWYTRGEGKGGDVPDNWYEDLLVETLTIDVGDGPIALEATAGTVLSPSWYFAELPPPPAGVPFGQDATLSATFDGLPNLALDLAVPSDILPIDHALDVAALSSEQIASWTWSTPGGAEPIELDISFGATPPGTGWSEVVRIQCDVTDDGEFAFPIDYLDLARERLGPDLYASARLTREATGSTALAGKQLLWRSSVNAWLSVEVAD